MIHFGLMPGLKATCVRLDRCLGESADGALVGCWFHGSKVKELSGMTCAGKEANNANEGALVSELWR